MKIKDREVKRMNSKRWTVVVIAIILVVASSISAVGLSNQNENLESSFNSLFQADSASEVIIEEGSDSERVLVMNIEGPIMENAISTGYDHQALLQAAEQIREDDSIKAVLLSLDTPGGSVYLTRELYDLFMEIKEETELPVYASMGSMAASAGYYLSVMADEVYATPETLTGSIGVIMSGYNIEGLQDKIGIEPYVFKSGPLKDMGSSNRQMTEEEEKVFQNYIDEAYGRFVQVVEDGRDMDEAKVKKLADGRIYTAQQALDQNLIDGIQYEREVMDKIKNDIGVENPQFFELASNPYDFSSPFSFFSSSFFDKLTQSELEKNIKQLEELSRVKIEYRWEGY